MWLVRFIRGEGTNWNYDETEVSLAAIKSLQPDSEEVRPVKRSLGPQEVEGSHPSP